ncbi:MAG: hypothetical protein JF608_14850 [Sphingomonadales bacterium]|jgi:hypothetical protein|nr:hypothetical protein [Sphingomonadales bacterium]
MPDPRERDRFARRAVELRDMAQVSSDGEIRKALESMAASYDKLVEEADRAAWRRSASRPTA